MQDNLKPKTIYELPVTGRFLMEANAGSGKTWQIATFYLWLIVEHGFAVDTIVVTTYTKSATEELRERIVKRLEEFQKEFQLINRTSVSAKRPTNNSFGLPDSAWDRLMQQVGLVSNRLNQACTQLEQVRVSTIHGYYLNLLQTHALPSGEPLQNNIMHDETITALKTEAIHYAWRQLALTDFFATTSAQFFESINNAVSTYIAKYLNHNDEAGEGVLWRNAFLSVFPEPDDLKGVMKPCFDMPNIVVDEPVAPDTMELDTLHQLFAAMAEAYRKLDLAKTELVDTLMSVGLTGTTYKANNIPQKIDYALRALDVKSSITLPTDEAKKQCKSLFADVLREKQTKAGKKAVPNWQPDTLFFDLQLLLPKWWAWQKAVHDWLYVQLFLAAKNLALKHFSSQQSQRQAMPFAEVIAKAHRAFVTGKNANVLVCAEQAQTRVWLVDEFQDTDAEQWAIIKALQGGNEANEKAESAGLVMAVGDPKQAIYNFRGADLNAYLQARSEMSAPPLTLLANYRATAKVVQAVNEWLAPIKDCSTTQAGENEGVFLNSQISYQKSLSEREQKKEELLPAIDTPFLWINPTGGYHKRRKAAVHHALLEYKRLSTLYPPFTAVILVNTNAEGSYLATAADEIGVRVHFASSRYHWQKIVMLMYSWLAALNIQDGKRALIKLGLTPLLPSLNAEDWQLLITANKQYQDKAQKTLISKSLIRQIDAIALQQKTLRNSGLWGWWQMLWQEDGVALRVRLQTIGFTIRDITALKALVIHLLSVADNTQGQLAWLFECIQGRQTFEFNETKAPEVGVLEIATIHRAKGRQWDVVFCPYMDDPYIKPYKEYLYFKDDVWRLSLFHDGGEDAESHAISKQIAITTRQEAIRKQYVAMTRAIHRGYFYFLPRDKAVEEAKNPHACEHLIIACTKAANAKDDDTKADNVINNTSYAAWQRYSTDDLIEANEAEKTSLANKKFKVAAKAPLVRVTEPAPLMSWQIFWQTSFSGLLRQGTEQQHYDDNAQAADVNNSLEIIKAMAMIDEPESEINIIEKAKDPKQNSNYDKYGGKELGNDVHYILATVINRRRWSSHSVTAEQQQQWIIDAINAQLNTHEADYQALVSEWVMATLSKPWSFLPTVAKEGSIPLPDEESAEWSFSFGWAHEYDDEDAKQAWQVLMGQLSMPNITLPKNGLLRGSLDWLLLVGNKYYIIDFKTNRLPDTSNTGLATLIQEHGYGLQAIIYQYALHRHLQLTLPDYQPKIHLGGVAFLFLRAMQSNDSALSLIPANLEQLTLMSRSFVQHEKP